MCGAAAVKRGRNYTQVAANRCKSINDANESVERVKIALLSARLQGQMTKVHETKVDTRPNPIGRAADEVPDAKTLISHFLINGRTDMLPSVLFVVHLHATEACFT
jgi:hypothetical protein